MTGYIHKHTSQMYSSIFLLMYAMVRVTNINAKHCLMLGNELYKSCVKPYALILGIHTSILRIVRSVTSIVCSIFYVRENHCI